MKILGLTVEAGQGKDTAAYTPSSDANTTTQRVEKWHCVEFGAFQTGILNGPFISISAWPEISISNPIRMVMIHGFYSRIREINLDDAEALQKALEIESKPDPELDTEHLFFLDQKPLEVGLVAALGQDLVQLSFIRDDTTFFIAFPKLVAAHLARALGILITRARTSLPANQPFTNLASMEKLAQGAAE